VRIHAGNQLPLTLARLLNAKGAEFRHVLERNLGKATDGEIWRYASAHGMVLISKDDGFFHLSGQLRAGVQLVWVRLGNCRNPKLLAVFDALWPRIHERLDDGDRIVEVW
jgi:predicted nuclease of predicted toxin-antitoxin system